MSRWGVSDSPPDIAALSPEALRILVERLLEENAAQRAEIARLQDALAESKRLKGRPKLKPSGMEKKAEARRKAKQGRKAARRPRGAKRLNGIDPLTWTPDHLGERSSRCRKETHPIHSSFASR